MPDRVRWEGTVPLATRIMSLSRAQAMWMARVADLSSSALLVSCVVLSRVGDAAHVPALHSRSSWARGSSSSAWPPSVS